MHLQVGSQFTATTVICPSLETDEVTDCVREVTHGIRLTQLVLCDIWAVDDEDLAAILFRNVLSGQRVHWCACGMGKFEIPCAAMRSFGARDFSLEGEKEKLVLMCDCYRNL